MGLSHSKVRPYAVPLTEPDIFYSIEKRFMAFHSQARAHTHPLLPYASQE